MEHSDMIASYLRKSYTGRHLLNVVSLYDTNFEDTLPIILSIYNQNLLHRYIAATASHDLNRHAIRLAELASINFLLPKFYKGTIEADITETDIKSELDEYYTDLDRHQQQPVYNLLLLLGSCLGNFADPDMVLGNIRASMNPDDLVLISQDIYQPGSEDELVSDYARFFEVMQDTQDVVRAISPEYEMKFRFNDAPDFHGVEFYFKTTQQASFGDVQVDPGTELTVFRSKRFLKSDLESTLERNGFEIIEAVYDGDTVVTDETGNTSFIKGNTNGLYLLKIRS